MMHKEYAVEGTESLTLSKPPTIGSGSNDRGTAASAAVSDEAPPSRSRRGGRRVQRRAMLQESEGLTKTAPTETVVVPVHGEPVTTPSEKRQVNCTSVRRRAKQNSTITKVVTGVSLEDLRAKRNGTAAENAPDKDAKTIEEVSRILLMYASQQQQQQGAWKHHLAKRLAPMPSVNSDLSSFGEGISRVGVVENTATMEPGSTAVVGGQQLHNFDGRLDGARNAQTQVTEMIQLGELPPESLEILQAMLCHSSRSVRFDAIEASKRYRHGGDLTALGATVGDPYQQHQQLSLQQADFYCYLQQQQQQQQQQQFIDHTEEGFLGYGDYVSSTEAYHATGCISPSELMARGCHATIGDGVATESVGTFPLVGTHLQDHHHHHHHRQQQQQQQGHHWYDCNVAAGGVMDCKGTANTFGFSMWKDAGDDVKDDDDDDADVTAMLHGIREVVQGASSPQKIPHCGASSEKAASASDNHDDASFQPCPSAPCVTISQWEREALRSIQKAFLSRMRVTGSPDWKSPQATPSKSIPRSSAEDDESDGQLAWERQQDPQEEEKRSATNRTLFLYRTAVPENGVEEMSNEVAMREISVETVAAQQEQRKQERCESESALTEAQLSALFSVMRGGVAQEDDGEVHWPWTTGDDRLGRGAAVAAEDDDTRGAAVAAATTTTATTTTATPPRWCDGSADRYTRLVSTISATPQQPTTQKKQLLQVTRSPYSPAACDLPMPTCHATLGATPLEMGKRNSTVLLNRNAAPFLPTRRGTNTTYFP